MKKFIVEFGMGTDFHGQDVTKAAKKAVKDAVSRSCLCGLDEVLGLTVAVSRPEEVDCAEVASALPVGTVEVRPVKGGLTVDGLCIEAFGDRDCSIEAALAAVEVFITE